MKMEDLPALYYSEGYPHCYIPLKMSKKVFSVIWGKRNEDLRASEADWEEMEERGSRR